MPFYYTGCGGNKNNFESRDACESDCPPKIGKDFTSLSDIFSVTSSSISGTFDFRNFSLLSHLSYHFNNKLSFLWDGA